MKTRRSPNVSFQTQVRKVHSAWLNICCHYHVYPNSSLKCLGNILIHPQSEYWHCPRWGAKGPAFCRLRLGTGPKWSTEYIDPIRFRHWFSKIRISSKGKAKDNQRQGSQDLAPQWVRLQYLFPLKCPGNMLVHSLQCVGPRLAPCSIPLVLCSCHVIMKNNYFWILIDLPRFPLQLNDESAHHNSQHVSKVNLHIKNIKYIYRYT